MIRSVTYGSRGPSRQVRLRKFAMPRPEVYLADSRLKFQIHPPERRRKDSIVLCGCCCTCCCCCCLHSLGAALGSSLVNSHIEVPERVPLTVTDRKTITGRPIYQIILLTLTAAVVFGMHLYAFIDHRPKLNDWSAVLAIEVVILLLAYPAVQLGAVLLAMVGTAVFAKPELKGLYARSLLRILGGMAAGFGIGLVLTITTFGFIILTMK